MRSILRILLTGLATVSCASCSFIDEFRTGNAAVVKPRQADVAWNGPKLAIAVGPFEDATGIQQIAAGTGTTIQTGAANAPPDKEITIRRVGTGMRAQLTTYLAQTGVFRVFDTLDAKSTVDWIVRGAVTAYEPSTESIAGAATRSDVLSTAGAAVRKRQVWRHAGA